MREYVVMMKKMAAGVVLAMALAGCAQPQRQVSWYPGPNVANAGQDQFECRRDATMMYPVGVGDVVSQAVANVNRDNAFAQCLSAKGWVAR